MQQIIDNIELTVIIGWVWINFNSRTWIKYSPDNFKEKHIAIRHNIKKNLNPNIVNSFTVSLKKAQKGLNKNRLKTIIAQ